MGRIASEEVTLQLVNSKCIPVSLFDLEACPVSIYMHNYVLMYFVYDFIINK